MSLNPLSLRDASDASFFRLDPFGNLSLEVIRDPAPEGVVIGGAKKWNPSVESSYPLVAAVKSLRPNGSPFLRKRYGNVLVRNLTDGSLVARQAWSTEGKMPLHLDSEPSESPPRVDEKESTDVLQDWVRLESDLAMVPPSTLEITTLFGDQLSNSLLVEAGSPAIRGEDTVGWHRARLPLSAEERMDGRFALSRLCPPPTTAGIVWKRTEESSQPGSRWPLVVGFAVDESCLVPEAPRLSLHLVFAWLGSESALHLDVRVPLERTRSWGNLRQGNFELDLHPLFQEGEGAPEIVPTGLHLVAFCGNQRSGPAPIDL